jgi:hypothetical protein
MIGDYAFQYCAALRTISIPNSVTSLGKSVFVFCSSLESVEIPNSITIISSDLFGACASLKNVVIPTSVTSIETHAFSGCSSLQEIVLPHSIGSIGYYAFGESGLKSITIPNSIVTIAKSVFYNSGDLTSLIFEDGEANISVLSYAFSACPLKNVHFGRQFDFTCVPRSSLETISFGENITSISNGAFKDSSNLSTVISYNPVPPTTDDTFSSKTYIDGSLYVPESAIDAYASAPGWKDFWEINSLDNYNAVSSIYADSDASFSVSDGTLHIVGDAPVCVVAINGSVVYSGRGNCDIDLNKGLYVVVIGDKASKVAVR